MKLFDLFKKKKYTEEENYKRASREELGLLPEEELDEDIFVKPEADEQHRASTLKNVAKNAAPKSASAKKAKPKTESSAPQKTDEGTKPKNDKKSNSATKVEAEKKQPDCEPIQKKAKEGAPERLANFEIKKAKDGRFVFNLYASNHVIVATSQIYTTSQAALNGINSVITNAKKAPIEDTTLKKFEAQSYPKWEIYLDKGEQFRFRLYAPNGSCICHSQGYTSKTNCKNGIASIIKSCENHEITKAYLNKETK